MDVRAGDLLINTAWYWHAIINDAPTMDDLVIAVPTRIAIQYSLPAFKSNALLSTIALSAITRKYGGMSVFTEDPKHLQDGIESSRSARAKQRQLMESRDEE